MQVKNVSSFLNNLGLLLKISCYKKLKDKTLSVFFDIPLIKFT